MIHFFDINLKFVARGGNFSLCKYLVVHIYYFEFTFNMQGDYCTILFSKIAMVLDLEKSC